MGKPRAARRQPIIVSSEDEGSDSPPSKRPRRGPLTSAARHGARVASRDSKPASSPLAVQKSPAKSPAKSPSKPQPGLVPITSFFSNAPRPQTRQLSPTPPNPLASTPVDDDILDSSGDDQFNASRSVKGRSNGVLLRRKRDEETLGPDQEGLTKASARFLRAANSNRGPSPLSHTSADVDTRPWNERFTPSNLDELAVHKKKVSDVRTWLTEVFAGRERKRLLLLKGPAGSGKTTTLTLLSNEIGFDIREWKNPISTSSSDGFVSVTAQFDDFVGRTGTLGGLAFEEPVSGGSRPLVDSHSRQKQLMLVEEFPNTFARASSSVQSFRTSVLNFLATNTPSAASFFAGQVNSTLPITPIVMIISETLLSTNTAAADSFTAHRLLGPEILTHPGVTVIDFNPVAPTYMIKALDLLVIKEARRSGRKKTAGPQVLQRLAELGDIRNAISSLEFLCVRGDEDEGWGSRVTFTKKKGSKNTPLTQMERESLEMIMQRESSLGIFHAVGRVVHNKRLPESTGQQVPQPPNWFPERRRPKIPEANVDTLIDELGTDTHTFASALHENYVLSCEGGDSEETLDSIEGCIDALSDADLLSPDRFSGTGFGRRGFSGTSSDSLRQDEMSFQVGVRGLLFYLPHPTKRVTALLGTVANKGTKPSKRDPFVMYYPTSLRIWRTQEEIGGLLELWITRAQKGELLTSTESTARSIGQQGGVETWARATNFGATNQYTSCQSSADSHPLVLLGSGSSARFEMLLERLPYLPLILRKRGLRALPPSTWSTIREIQKITSFTGTGVGFSTADDDNDQDDEPVEQEQWSTDVPTPQKLRKMNVIQKKTGPEASTIAERPKAALVLSEDDIED